MSSTLLTTNLKIPKVAGADLVSKEVINDAIDVIDANALHKSHAATKAHFEMWTASHSYGLMDTVRTTTSSSWMIYVCTTPGVSGTTEPSLVGVGDTCTDGTVVWQLRSIGDEGLIITDWAPTHRYTVGDFCINGKVLYRCIATHTSPSSFNIAQWQAISQDIIPFATGRSYAVGDIVLYKDKLFRCLTAGTAVTMFVPADWQEISGGTAVIEDWKASTNYERDQVVLYDGCLYRARFTSFTSGTTFNGANWLKVADPTIKDFQPNYNYLINEPVVYNGTLYKAVTSFKSGASFVSTDWTRIDSLSLIHNWATSTDYVVDEVVLNDGVLYRCKRAHNSASTFASDKADWDAIAGKHLADNWAPSTAYAVNEVAVNGGKLYRCKTAHTSGLTFDATEEAMWETLGGGGSGSGGCHFEYDSDGNLTPITSGGSSPAVGASIRSWDTGKAYSPFELLEKDKMLYMVTTAHTSTTISADITSGYIKKIGPSVSGAPDWTASTPYDANALVYNADKLYICTTAHTSDASDMAVDILAGKWKFIGNGLGSNAHREVIYTGTDSSIVTSTSGTLTYSASTSEMYDYYVCEVATVFGTTAGVISVVTVSSKSYAFSYMHSTRSSAGFIGVNGSVISFAVRKLENCTGCYIQKITGIKITELTTDYLASLAMPSSIFVSIDSLPYTAPANGYVRFSAYCSNDYGVVTIRVNGYVFFNNTCMHKDQYVADVIPVKKGDVVTNTGLTKAAFASKAFFYTIGDAKALGLI